MRDGVPWWLSGLKPLPSAPVMVSGSWDQAPHWALCSGGACFPFSLCLPLCLLVISLSVKINKYNFLKIIIKKHEGAQPI